jgi:hypothetical protein
VRAQILGQIVSINFTEGQAVHPGDKTKTPLAVLAYSQDNTIKLGPPAQFSSR